MESTDLCIPIYLNQQIVFDLLAVLEDGFSQISNIKTSASEAVTNKYGMGASIGASNVFALLGISFSGERGKEKGSQEQTETTREKVHTPTSLFARLRLKLQERNLIHSIELKTDLGKLQAGEFIEFRALLRKNPLVDAMEGIRELMNVVLEFSEANDALKGSKSLKTGKTRNSNDVLLGQMDKVLGALAQSDSIELIGELLDAPNVKSVLTARLDFFSQGNSSEIIDGEFRILGKITRIVDSTSGEPINLLRKTTFGRLNRQLFDQLFQGFGKLEEAGLSLPRIVTEIEGPALQVIPIAIFA